MRNYLLLSVAMLVAAPVALAAELKAGPLFVICSDKKSDTMSVGCEAFTEGFVQGLTAAGMICPPPDAHKQVVRDLLALPRSEIGDGTVAAVLVPRLKVKYPCPKV